MFGLWKYYEREFTVFEDGYAVQTWRGLKFLLPEERDLLIASYRSAMAFDFKRIMIAVLIMVAVIAIATITMALFDLPAIVMDIIPYAASLGMMLFVCKPLWDHYQMRHRFYAKARTLPQNESWQKRWLDKLSAISWIRIALGLLIYGWVLYRLILIWSVKPLEPLPGLIGIAIVAGIAYLSLAAVCKLIRRDGQPD